MAASLYIHIPFCLQKCSYCAFQSGTPQKDDLEAFLPLLFMDLSQTRRFFGVEEQRLTSIFFGGGTPSFLTAEMIPKIMDHVRALWSLSPQCEITLEANPESVNRHKLSLWHQCGVNRLSFGVQAMDNHRLHLLGRPHDVERVHQVYGWAREEGFGNINLDLIHGSPGHTLEQWQGELAQAVALGPEHLSCYGLTVEKGTSLAQEIESGKWSLLGEEVAEDLYFFTHAFLVQQGWERYEISNFARDGRYCQHNLHAWRSQDYLGVGPSAHGRVTLADGSILRTECHDLFRDYLQSVTHGGSPYSWVEISTAEEVLADYLIMGLRLREGIPRRWGGLDLARERANVLREEGLMWMTEERMGLSEKGLDLADMCISYLI